MLFLTLLACDGPTEEDSASPPPLGMILVNDDQVYAGVAQMDITPEIIETYTDINGNNQFDGCMTDPEAVRTGCEEPYDDVDGDGHFNGVWIAGYQSERAALGVHDPIKVTAVVISLNGEYVALVGIDAIGLLENRSRDVRDALDAEGFDRNRILISSSHAHSAPDTVGIWGLPDQLITGVYPPYMETVAPSIVDIVTIAAGSMVAVSPTQGQYAMSDDPTMNGAPFGGTNPDPSVVGSMNDIRDPLIPGDIVWALALDGAEGRVATVISASGHPETTESEHSLLSADYVGVARDWIDSHDGGTTVFLSGALGGMQSASGGTLPKVDFTTGERILDDQGLPVYDTTGGGWDFMTTDGILVAQAAQAALTDTTPWDSLSIRQTDFLIPVDNVSFKLAFQTKLIETPVEYVVQDSTCPGYGIDEDNFGCVPGAAWMLRLGPSTLGTVPGELFPELFYGVPDEPAMTDGAQRASDARWVQWDADCVGVDDAACLATTGSIGECDCLQYHTVPYRISDQGASPIIDMLPGTYKVPVGIVNAYCGYIPPTPDFNTKVSVLTDDGDHYEETNSCTSSFGDIVLDAFADLTQ